MQTEDTSDNDISVNSDPKFDLISSLRKENLYLQTKIGELQAKIQNFLLLDEKYKNSTEKLKYANSKISDLKYRLQISINQNQENQNKFMIENAAQNQFYVSETNKLKNKNEQLLNKNNFLSSENKQLKEKIDSLSHKRDIDLSSTNNKNEMLLSAAKSFFQISFNTIDQLKEYFSNNSLPPSVFPEKDKKIESQIEIINDLRKKCKKTKKNYELLIKEKMSEIEQLNQKIQSQQLVINDLNLQFEQKTQYFIKKISKIKAKIPKQKKLRKFTSSSISIMPEPNKVLNQIKENRDLNSSKLIDSLNDTISQLQEENKKIQNELFNYKIQLQKLKAENDLKQEQITKYCIELKSLKKEYDLKIKLSNDKIRELQISNKIPDPFIENLITSAKTKISQQKENIIYKNSQLSNLTNEIDHLKILISQQKIEIARLKAELEKAQEKSIIQTFSEFQQNYTLPIQEKTESNCFIFNYSDINPKLQLCLRPIIDCPSLSAESKLQIAIKKIDSFYTSKLAKKKKYKEINCSIEKFVSEMFQLLTGHNFNFENLSKNIELQSQAIETLKVNKRKLENVNNILLTQKNKISFLKKKLIRTKKKLALFSNQKKKINFMKSEIHCITSENEKLKTENEEYKQQIDLLKSENTELYSVLEYEKNHIIQIKKEQTNSLGEYEDIIKKMKRKYHGQRETIKYLSECNC